MAKHTCRWVLVPYSKGVQAKYCERPTRYHMVIDDDDNKVREYYPFCSYHTIAAEEQERAQARDDESSL